MSRLITSSNSILGLIDEVDVSSIKPPVHHIRRSMDADEIDDLAKSILQNGLLQPLIVRMKANHFEIVAGNRRFNACKKLGWRKIICHIMELTDKEAFEVSLTENVQKETLNPIDEALAFKNYVNDHGWGGMSELATKLGRSICYISKRIKLLDLPSDIIDSVSKFTLDTSIAEELLYLKDESKQSELAELISKRNISFRKARTIIKQSEHERTYDRTYQVAAREYEARKIEKSFDKSVIALRIALNKLAYIIQENDANWILYETLMQHKNMLHNQIDLLIKNKKKYEYNT